MIQANELRIGNIVKVKNPRHSEEFIVVESIGFELINLEFREYKIDDLLPIPLTEEWLLKFGCLKIDNKEQKQYRFKDRLIVMRGDFYYDYGSSVKLEFVHKFQNLYFELNDEK